MRLQGWRRWAATVGLVLAPLLAAFYVSGTQIAGSVLLPWQPGMIDLQVYQRTGLAVLGGADIFSQPEGALPWVYPPFAAVLTVPFALLPFTLAAVVWLVLCVGALAAVLFRLGLTGWRLSLATFICVLFVEPVAETIGFGQLGIFLVAAAVLDSMPGPRLLRRRVLPEGWMTGLATAVKLTPAVVAAYNFFAGRRRPGIVAFVAFLIATAVGVVLLPTASVHYWLGLLLGDSGLNDSIIYATNQSVLGVWTRLLGSPDRVGLALGGVAAIIGIWGAVSLHRAGEVKLAICVAGITSLLASPISWSHHYVWIVPLGIVLWQRSHLPGWFRWFALGYVAWGVIAPFKWIRRGDGVEHHYNIWEQSLVNIGVFAGLVLLVMSIVVGRQLRTLPRVP